jgi:serine phosphatase RsbU (regulator of sigma subunit)
MLRDSRLVLVAGFGESTQYPEIPLDPSLPAAENLEQGVPLFVESRAELSRRWPALARGPTSSFAALPLIVEDRRLGVMAVGFPDEHHFAPDEREYLTVVAEQAAIALARAESREALQEARSIAESRREQLDFLATASARLSRSLDLAVTLDTVAELGVPRLTDRCALFLLEDGKISKRVLAPDLSTDEWRLFDEAESSLSSRRGIGAVIRTARPEYIREIDDPMLVAAATSPEHLELLRKVGFGGLLILPLRTRGKTLGALAFVNRKGRVLDEETRSLAEELAGRAAVAIDNAARYQTESHIAHRLARSLLPARLPAIAGLDVAVRYQAGSAGIDVGGDFYDLFETGDGGFLVVIGDVQGKGVEAAALTGLARHTVRASARYDTSPAALLQRLNEAILLNIIESGASIDRPGTDARLCTAAMARLERRGPQWSATVSCAGHPSPLLRRTDGEVESICESALLLGVHEQPHYDEAVAELRPGSVLVLYTDGVSERHADDHMFGSEGIAEVLRNTNDSASQIADHIIEAALDHASRREDDLVVLVVKVEP